MSDGDGVHAVPLAAGVGAWFSGSTLAGADDANLAHHRPHIPARLASARDAVGRHTGTDPAAWHLMRQVHGATVALVDDTVPPGAELRDVDAAVTVLADRPLVVLAADCLPLLLAGERAVGVAHAGWRGVVGDVVGAAVGALTGLGERVEDLRVVIGPAIGPCCYDVGEDVAAAVVDAAGTAAVRTRTRDGRLAVDLRGAVRARLDALGAGHVADGPDGSAHCTACGSGWFSHRRDPDAGRHAGLVVRTLPGSR